MKERYWGVIGNFELATDTFTSLKAACEIMLTEHKAEGFAQTENSGGVPQLEIIWSVDRHGSKFLTPIEDAETLANAILKWLEVKGRYDKCEQWDTDGDLEMGYKISSNKLSHWSVMFTVTPEYIIYGK